MLARNLAPAAIDAAASAIGAVAMRQARDKRRFVLRPSPACIYRRVSASYGGRGRRVHAICWHGHREFFRILFADCPADARVDTALASYTPSNFESTYMRSDKNIGPPVDPIRMSSCCSCPEGDFANDD